MGLKKRIIRKIANIAGLKVYDSQKLYKQYDKWGSVKRDNIRVKTCIDIGVGRGTKSMYEAVDYENLVLVEPLSVYKEDIKKIKKNTNAIWVKKAASSNPGEEAIMINKDKPEKSSFLERKKEYKRSGKKEEVIVEKDTIDKIVKEYNLKGSYGIKVDTEGYDLEVIKGAKKTLSETKWLSVEVPIINRFKSTYNIEDITDMMSKEGFYIAGVVGMDADTPVKFIDFIFFNKTYR